jgi:hypothetical protein
MGATRSCEAVGVQDLTDGGKTFKNRVISSAAALFVAARNLALKMNALLHSSPAAPRRNDSLNPVYRSILFLLCLLFHSAPARSSCARQVSVKDGNIFVTDEGDKTRQITSAGLDSEPALSVDGTLLVFIREIKVPKPVLYGEPWERSEIWLAACSDDWRPRPILKGPVPDKPSRQAVGLVCFRAPQFSPDKARIYFLNPEYSVTTSGLSYLNRSSGAVHFFATALDYWVVQKGSYAGDLILDQDPQTYVEGRIEIYYLFSPNGKQLGIVGFTKDSVKFFLDEFAK